jgi:hypothetical protein
LAKKFRHPQNQTPTTQTPTTPTRNHELVKKFRHPQDDSEDGSGNRKDIPTTTKISQLKKYLRQKKYVHHPQYHTPTRAMLCDVSCNSELDVSSDSDLDDSSFVQEEEDEVEDDRHIVHQTLSKG